MVGGKKMHIGLFFAQAEQNLEGVRLTQEQLIGLVLVILVVMAIVSLVVHIIIAICLGKLFKKARLRTWKAWIPIYNLWVFLELGKQKGYWAVIAPIPAVNLITLIFIVLALRRLHKKSTSL